MHGGLSSNLIVINQLKQIKRPTENRDKSLLCDLVWSYPDNLTIKDFINNKEGGLSFTINLYSYFLRTIKKLF